MSTSTEPRCGALPMGAGAEGRPCCRPAGHDGPHDHYSKAPREGGQEADLASALERMVVGVTQKSTPHCDYYDGILHDALDEARRALGLAAAAED